MAPMIDDPGGRVLRGLSHNQALRRRCHINAGYLCVGATGKWQDETNQSQHL